MRNFPHVTSAPRLPQKRDQLMQGLPGRMKSAEKKIIRRNGGSQSATGRDEVLTAKGTPFQIEAQRTKHFVQMEIYLYTSVSGSLSMHGIQGTNVSLPPNMKVRLLSAVTSSLKETVLGKVRQTRSSLMCLRPLWSKKEKI